ncbi:MAG: nitroreductase family protein [Spirochaetes bacterium]|nr:nitroreductase family protein [Spirochaetota bacterium]
MSVKEIIQKRRAFRSLEKIPVTGEIIEDLAFHASLAPSCFNHQPWEYVFVHDKEVLEKMHAALSKGNEWARSSSMIIAVVSKREKDCQMKDGREYFYFDVGSSTAFLVLRATEMGLVAHPIAGYDQNKVKKILNIPEDMTVVTLVIVGKHSSEINQLLSEDQKKNERERPPRKPLGEFAFINKYLKK